MQKLQIIIFIFEFITPYKFCGILLHNNMEYYFISYVSILALRDRMK